MTTHINTRSTITILHITIQCIILILLQTNAHGQNKNPHHKFPQKSRINLHHLKDAPGYIIEYKVNKTSFDPKTHLTSSTLCDIKVILKFSAKFPFEPITDDHGCIFIKTKSLADSVHLEAGESYIFFYWARQSHPNEPYHAFQPRQSTTFRILIKNNIKYIFGEYMCPVTDIKPNGDILLGKANLTPKGQGYIINTALPFIGLTRSAFITKIKHFVSTADPSLKPAPTID